MHIVVVDDNELFVDMISLYLSDKGFDVTSFTNPLEALEYCRSNDCSLLLTDLSMAELNGIELADAVRQVDPSIRILLVSGHVDEEDKNQKAVFARHFDAALAKPVLLQALLLTIQELLEENVNILPMISELEQPKLQEARG